MSETQLLLLRHGEVASHRGDVPVTAAGLEHAEDVGSAIAHSVERPVTLLYGGTRRTRETAQAIRRGLGDRLDVDGPHDSFALRNPDMFVAGARVNMVSSAENLAEQVPGMTAEQAAANSWWSAFFTAPDRIGWWLHQEEPPGDDARTLARRIWRFVDSLQDPGPQRGRLIVGITHSPVLRAMALDSGDDDPGEPAYVTGLVLTQPSEGRAVFAAYDALSTASQANT